MTHFKSPRALLSKYFRQVKEGAELEYGKSFSSTMLTVPHCMLASCSSFAHAANCPDFTDDQRAAFREAAVDAGIAVDGLTFEDSSVVIASGLLKSWDDNLVAVCDIGATTDISLLFTSDYAFDRLKTVHNSSIGGPTFNQRVLDHLLSTHFDNRTLNSDQLIALGRSVELAKIVLSENPTAWINLTTEDGFVPPFTTILTRSEFNGLNEDLFEQIVESIDKAVGRSRFLDPTLPEKLDHVRLFLTYQEHSLTASAPRSFSQVAPLQFPSSPDFSSITFPPPT